VAFVDGRAIVRAEWDLVLADDQVLAFIDVAAIPQGGGGGGSDPLRTVLMLAVLVMAPEIGAFMGPGMFGAGVLGMSAGAWTGVAMFAGMTLVNAILPPPKPTSPQQAAALAAPSPTYNLQAQGNAARIDAAIPEGFGRMDAFPDYAAQPYQEYAGNEQYLYSLLCLGRGEYSIESILIETTPITSFDEVTYEVVAPGGSVTLFPTNVTSSSLVAGQSLSCIAGTYSQSGTTVTVTAVAHGLAIGKVLYVQATGGTGVTGSYTVASVPTLDTFTYVASTSLTTSGTLLYSPWVGGFIANDSGTTANYVGIDFAAIKGLYYANDDGSLATMGTYLRVEARTVDSVGAPLTSFVQIGTTFHYTGATTTPQRYSQRIGPLTFARYEVRVCRIDLEQLGTRYGHALVWAGMRGYLQDTRTYGDVTLIAMLMRATNNLTAQASRKINVIATRKLPVWNGTTWSANTATRSIAWAIVYACKQIGMTDSQIDLAGLLALDSTWTGRGDYFDGRFDNFLSFWEAVTKIAITGRAKPYMQGGVLRIKRDQAQSIPVALFSTRNIVRGSFSIDYLMPTYDTADSVDVTYFDSTTWNSAKVRATLTGSTTNQPAKIDLFGVTSRAQAYREGIYQAASNVYRRRIVKFSTEMEGFIPSFGDLIAIQHDMPAWGQGGEVTAWNSGTLTLTLSEPVTFGSGTNYIGLRKRDGSVDGPYAVTAGGSANQVVFASAPASTPYTGMNEERTHFTFGAGATWTQFAIVTSAKPKDLYTIDMVAVVENSNVHTAESGLITPTLVTSQLAGYNNLPVVTGVTAYPSRDNLSLMVLTWPGAAWAQGYVIEQSKDGIAWTPSGSTSSTQYLCPMLYGKTTQFRVAAVGLYRGPWFTVAPDVTAPPPFDIFSIMVQPDGTRQYNFGYTNLANQPADWMGAEIRYVSGTTSTPDWATMSLLQDATTYYTNSPVELNAPLSGIYTFACKSLDTTGNESTQVVRNITLPDRRLGNVFDEFFEGPLGWLGTKTGCQVLGTYLEALDSTTWATTPATWAAWSRWNMAPTSPIIYVTPVRDFGTVIAGQVNATIDADGTALLELATSNDGTAWSAWGSASAVFAVRYIKLRLTVTATGPAPVPVVRDFNYQINAPMKSEYLNDIVLSSLTGSNRIGVGDIRIPLHGTYSVLKRTSIVIQDNSAGTWTYVRIDQTLAVGPRWQFRLNGVLADPAFVDFFVEGY
jgi:hypothetical protein